MCLSKRKCVPIRYIIIGFITSLRFFLFFFCRRVSWWNFSISYNQTVSRLDINIKYSSLLLLYVLFAERIIRQSLNDTNTQKKSIFLFQRATRQQKMTQRLLIIPRYNVVTSPANWLNIRVGNYWKRNWSYLFVSKSNLTYFCTCNISSWILFKMGSK